jgi:hypothetical protein
MLSSIAHFLGVKLKVTKHHNPPVEFLYVATCSQASNQVLVVYLTKLPLMGTKGLNSKDWTTVHKMVLSGQHITAKGKATIKEVKSGMNNGRTLFSWDHLDTFYS